ncbi:Proton/glutamate-aspartate symporter [invertebrate metagenome]|uniref:Proton/glutamate-aspartate symporter n=1 Tax=invertebrate metagenome TaxID=1711999 RepID=A0A2H9T6L7_9ZZZZ
MRKNTATYILLALITGLAIGALIQLISSKDSLLQTYLVDGLFWAGGLMFVNMIKLLIVPLVFVSIVHAVCSLQDISQFGRLGIKTFLLYLVNTAIAIIAAMGLSLIIAPGRGSDIGLQSSSSELAPTSLPSLLDLIVGIVPANLFEALVQGNILQILFMAIITGIAIKKLENNETHSISHVFRLANNVMMKLINMVMQLAPVGILFLSARLASTLSMDGLMDVMSYILTVLGILLFWLLFFYPIVISLITKINPLVFLSKIREQLFFALSTSSSNATIPITYKTLTEKLGVSEQIAGFAVPMGATMNMSGAAVYMTVATLFISNSCGLHLPLSQLVTLALTVFFLAIATGGIPGGAAVTVGILLQLLGLPAEAMAIIFATDRMLDAACTATNVVGDTVVATIVAKTELRHKITNGKNNTTPEPRISRTLPSDSST